jgi:hypothetical protein
LSALKASANPRSLSSREAACSGGADARSAPTRRTGAAGRNAPSPVDLGVPHAEPARGLSAARDLHRRGAVHRRGPARRAFMVAYANPDSEKLSAYECGFNAFDDARMKFDVRFYLVAILFIIFDLEVAFLFPWAITFGELGWFGFWSMMIFSGF